MVPSESSKCRQEDLIFATEKESRPLEGLRMRMLSLLLPDKSHTKSRKQVLSLRKKFTSHQNPKSQNPNHARIMDK